MSDDSSSYAWNKVSGKLFNNFTDSSSYDPTDGSYEDGHDQANAAYEGNQFAELNCEASGALYQDVPHTIKYHGTVMNHIIQTQM